VDPVQGVDVHRGWVQQAEIGKDSIPGASFRNAEGPLAPTTQVLDHATTHVVTDLAKHPPWLHDERANSRQAPFSSREQPDFAWRINRDSKTPFALVKYLGIAPKSNPSCQETDKFSRGASLHVW